jgi:hypothetical protein
MEFSFIYIGNQKNTLLSLNNFPIPYVISEIPKAQISMWRCKKMFGHMVTNVTYVIFQQ